MGALFPLVKPPGRGVGRGADGGGRVAGGRVGGGRVGGGRVGNGSEGAAVRPSRLGGSPR
jgi:hypothetical protein